MFAHRKLEALRRRDGRINGRRDALLGEQAGQPATFRPRQPTTLPDQANVGMVSVEFQDLYDIEKRPGAGVALWTRSVARQLERVRDANYRHRLHHSPNADEQRSDSDAELQLHADVYFLVLAIRRLLRFHDAFARQVDDLRLADARARFDAAASGAKNLRDLFEHIEEYLLDAPTKRVKFAGRAAPVLRSWWDSDNVIVEFGLWEMDVTLAAVAAIELGKRSSMIWDEHLERLKEGRASDPPGTNDGVPRVLTVSLGVSTIIGNEQQPPMVHTGTLLNVAVREAPEHDPGAPTTDASAAGETSAQANAARARSGCDEIRRMDGR